MSYYRDSLETYLGLTFDFIGILLEPSWDTLMSYLWVSSVLSWGLLVLLVAYLWPRKQINPSNSWSKFSLSNQQAICIEPLRSLQSVPSKSLLDYHNLPGKKCFCKDQAVVQIWSCASLPRHRWHGWPGVEGGVKPTAKTSKKTKPIKKVWFYICEKHDIYLLFQ